MLGKIMENSDPKSIRWKMYRSRQHGPHSKMTSLSGNLFNAENSLGPGAGFG